MLCVLVPRNPMPPFMQLNEVFLYTAFHIVNFTHMHIYLGGQEHIVLSVQP